MKLRKATDGLAPQEPAYPALTDVETWPMECGRCGHAVDAAPMLVLRTVVDKICIVGFIMVCPECGGCIGRTIAARGSDVVCGVEVKDLAWANTPRTPRRRGAKKVKRTTAERNLKAYLQAD